MADECGPVDVDTYLHVLVNWKIVTHAVAWLLQE